MGLLFSCCLCRKKRCVRCGVPFDYYNTNEHRSRPSCRGHCCEKPTYRGDYLNEYPGLYNRDFQNGYHKFN